MHQIENMKKGIFFLFFWGFSNAAMAQNEIGPEGNKLVWFIFFVLFVLVAYFFYKKRFSKAKTKSFGSLFGREKVQIILEKDARYYPDNLKLIVKNNGNADLDMDQPLLVFDNFWLKRKFRLKGMENRKLYPLYLEKGKTHSLDIDLTQFYLHDKRLKGYPKVKVFVHNVKGKKLGSCPLFLRKTLFKF